MGKTRVGVMIRESVKAGENQVTDLGRLTEKYQQFRKGAVAIHGSLKAHLGALQQLQKSREGVSGSKKVP